MAALFQITWRGRIALGVDKETARRLASRFHQTAVVREGYGRRILCFCYLDDRLSLLQSNAWQYRVRFTNLQSCGRNVNDRCAKR